MTEESAHEPQPAGDVTELIEWHTPHSPALPASRQDRPAEGETSAEELDEESIG